MQDNAKTPTEDTPGFWKFRLAGAGCGAAIAALGYFTGIGGLLFVGFLLFVMMLGMW